MAASGQFFVAEEGETADALVWRALGTHSARAVERVLAANPGLSALGPILPPGTPVLIPSMPAAVETQQVRLWD